MRRSVIQDRRVRHRQGWGGFVDGEVPGGSHDQCVVVNGVVRGKVCRDRIGAGIDLERITIHEDIGHGSWYRACNTCDMKRPVISHRRIRHRECRGRLVNRQRTIYIGVKDIFVVRATRAGNDIRPCIGVCAGNTTGWWGIDHGPCITARKTAVLVGKNRFWVVICNGL